MCQKLEFISLNMNCIQNKGCMLYLGFSLSPVNLNSVCVFINLTISKLIYQPLGEIYFKSSPSNYLTI